MNVGPALRTGTDAVFEMPNNYCFSRDSSLRCEKEKGKFVAIVSEARDCRVRHYLEGRLGPSREDSMQ